MSVFFTRRGKAGDAVNYAEWLESSGTQYVDLLFKPNQNTKIVLDMQVTSVAQKEGAMFYGVEGPPYFTSGKASSANYNIHTYYGSSGSTVLTKTATSVLDRLVLTHDKNVVSSGGTTYTFSAQTFQCSYNAFLFAQTSKGTPLFFTKMRLYSCQLYDNGTLVRDLWPAYDPDGIACLYDKVEKKYYYNAGTGEFIAGGEVDSGGGGSGETNQITFTYAGVQYTADAGMTWAQYINSDYNSADQFKNWNGMVRFGSSSFVVYNNADVLVTDTIIANATYTTG